MTPKVDGRRARGLRTREAIVDALMALVADGDVTPTAQRIAERAGVSVRSVYQHFSDVDSLFRQAGERLTALVTARAVDVDPHLGLEERVHQICAARAGSLELVTPYSRAARVMEPGSPALRETRAALLREARDKLEKVFSPELDRLGAAERLDLLDALDVVTSWPTWDLLRERGTGTERAQRIMESAVLLLVRGSTAVPERPGAGLRSAVRSGGAGRGRWPIDAD